MSQWEHGRLPACISSVPAAVKVTAICIDSASVRGAARRPGPVEVGNANAALRGGWPTLRRALQCGVGRRRYGAASRLVVLTNIYATTKTLPSKFWSYFEWRSPSGNAAGQIEILLSSVDFEPVLTVHFGA